MADIRVEPVALRDAATRIEQILATVDAVGARLAGATLAAPSAATELLHRGYGELQSEQRDVLRALADTLGDDADRLRRAADRYEEAECQSTIRTR